MVRVVFQKLVANALRLSADGDPPCLDVRAETRDGVCRLTFRDEGIGVEPELRETIFDLLVCHHAGALASHGLGLAIAKAAAQRANGTLELLPAEGPGASFLFVLPA